MPTSRDLGDELRRRRRHETRRSTRQHPITWDWGPARPSPTPMRIVAVIVFVAVAAVVLAALPAGGGSTPARGVAKPPKTTTTTTMMPPPETTPPAPETTMPSPSEPAPPPPPEPAPPVLEPQTLAPPQAAPGPQPMRIDLASGVIPEWVWAEPARLSPLGIAAMARAVGCTPAQAVIATAVGLAESGGRTDAVGDVHLIDKTWSYSSGVWQVRGLHAEHRTGRTRDPEMNLHNMIHNAWAMWEISRGCTNWQPWTMYTNGRWVSRAEEAILGVLQVEGIQP